MNKIRPLLLTLFMTSLLCIARVGIAITLPATALQGLEATQAWLNTLGSKSVDQIREELGEPDKQTEWSFEGKNESLWEYEIQDSKQRLQLYFFRGNVIKSSLHLLSK